MYGEALFSGLVLIGAVGYLSLNDVPLNAIFSTVAYRIWPVISPEEELFRLSA